MSHEDKQRRAPGDEPAPAEVIVGRHPVREALRAGRPLHRLLVRRGARDGSLGELVALAAAAGVVVQEVDVRRLDGLAAGANHQGVVAVPLARDYANFADLLARAASAGASGLLIVLDGIQDPQNLGSILRTADAAGSDGVIIPKRRAAGLTPAAVKASAGASEHVPVARVTNLARALDEIKEAGFWAVGADQDAEVLAWDADLRGKLALVIGGEGRGLSRLIRERCDVLVRFPMHGHVDSLNAGVACALLLYEVLRQRRASLKPLS